MSRIVSYLCVALLVAVVCGTAAAADTARAPFKNCTQLNRRYPHGVGRFGARDRTSGRPVTNFFRSNLIYRRAMLNNRGLDRDKDGIACEKH